MIAAGSERRAPPPRRGSAPRVRACTSCLRRTWLVAALAGHLERVARPGDVRALLALEDDQDLIDAVARGADARHLRARHRGFDADAARAACVTAGLGALCSCERAYPARLRDAPAPPAVLHVSDPDALIALADERPVAIVGARRGSSYGREVARSLARDLAACGVPVLSGLALGVDGAAHAGAVEAGGPTVAILAGGADVAYPASHRRLHGQVRAHGAVLSELPPGFRARRWCFPARNRIIAGLAELTVVVEAGPRSGALITAAVARELGRDVGAVPGQVTSTFAGGTNALIADGAALVASAQDVLDALYGAGARQVRSRTAARELEPGLRGLLEAVGAGRNTVAALAEHPDAAVGLTRLELLGLVRRTAGGAYVTVP